MAPISTICSLAVPILNAIPIIGPQATAVVQIIEAVDKVASQIDENKTRSEELYEYVNKLRISIRNHKSLLRNSPNTQNSLDLPDLLKYAQSYFDGVAQLLEQRKKKGMVTSLMKIEKVKNENEGLQRKLTHALDHMTTNTALHNVRETKAIREDLRELGAQAATVVRLIKSLFFKEEGDSLLMLHPVHSAYYDLIHPRALCLARTRSSLLKDITAWINNKNQGASVFLLTGLAGDGKTTIAHTLCQILHDDHKLGGSFFFDCHIPEQTSSESVVRTLAFQLAHLSPQLQTIITQTISQLLDVTQIPIDLQIEKFISAPLKTATDVPSPIAFVIDALDECTNEGYRLISRLVSALEDPALRSRVEVKLFITGRSGSPAIAQFTNIQHVTYELHKSDPSIVDSDIRIYLNHELDSIRRSYHIADEWPSKSEFEALVSYTGGLFIVASTICRFLAHNTKGSGPRYRLSDFLRSSQGKHEANSDIDTLYLKIIQSEMNDEDHTNSEQIRIRRVVLNTITLLKGRLPRHALVYFTELSDEQVLAGLSPLYPVLDSSGTTPPGANDIVRVFHHSFSDFITNRIDLYDRRFIVDAAESHARLFRRCREVMTKYLKYDICNIKDPSLLNSDIDDLSWRIESYITPELAYACHHWLSHLILAIPGRLDILEGLMDFLSRHILSWLEVCSLIKVLPSVLVILREAKELPLLKKNSPELAAIFHDAERLIFKFYPAISVASLQVYYTAYTLLPGCSLFTRANPQVPKCFPQLVSYRPKKWNVPLLVIDGHTDAVTSLDLSPDGLRVVSGSQDGFIRIWNTHTGVIEAEHRGHRGAVFNVVFTDDGRRIISGGEDANLVSWDSVQEQCFEVLRGHTSSVRSVSATNDGRKIVFGSEDHSVWALDQQKNKYQFKRLVGHCGIVASVKISEDGALIFSASHDKTVRVWDFHTRKCTRILKGHTGPLYCLAISPDHVHIASAGEGGQVRIWNHLNSTNTITLESNDSSSIHGIVFSPSGSHIITGDDGHCTRIRRIDGSTCATFSGHTSAISAVAISPDGRFVLSAARDRTIRVWDAMDYQLAPSPDTDSVPNSTRVGKRDRLRAAFHSARVTVSLQLSRHRSIESDTIHLGAIKSTMTSSGVSQGGTMIATGYENGSIHLLDTSTDNAGHILSGHSRMVNDIAWSSDASLLVSGSLDCTVRIWNPTTYRSMVTLESSYGSMTSVAICPKLLTVYAGSKGVVRAWKNQTNTKSWTMNNDFEGHESWVNSILVSPDGLRLTTGSDDKTIRVWDAPTGSCLYVIRGYPSVIVHINASTCNRIIAADVSRGISMLDLTSVELTYPLSRRDTGVQPSLFYIDRHGWLFGPAKYGLPAKRLCWIPISRRPDPPYNFQCFYRSGVVTIISGRGRLTRLDVSGLLRALERQVYI